MNPSHIIADEQGNVGPVVKWRSTLHKTFSGSHQTLNDKQGNEDIEEEEKFLEEEMKTECDHVNKPPISVRSVSLAAIQRAQMVCVCYLIDTEIMLLYYSVSWSDVRPPSLE